MLILDNINSVSDVITNSSSELFIINDKNTTLDHLKNIINPILDGYYEPFVFNLDTFRKWVESSEEDTSDIQSLHKEISSLYSKYFKDIIAIIVDNNYHTEFTLGNPNLDYEIFNY